MKSKNKIKLYYLYFFIPVIVCSTLNVYKEADIFFLIKHGEYIINHGFPIVEPLTIHSNFSFVCQQWLSSIIFYLANKLLGVYGLKLILEAVNCLLIYILYKICMLISDNKVKLSIACSCIIEVLLLTFFVPRPWIFTFLNLSIILYILELFYKNPKTKIIYILPLISLLQINIHSSMWIVQFLFILPYLISLIVNRIKDKDDKRIYTLVLVILLMLISGLINPYGIKNITYIFNSYGNYYINNLVVEIYPPLIAGKNYAQILFGIVLFILIVILVSIYIIFKKGKLELRYYLLTIGTVIMALVNIRSIPLFIMGSFIPLAYYLKPYFNNISKEEIEDSKNNYKIVKIFLFTIVTVLFFTFNVEEKNETKFAINKILEKNNPEDVVLYTNYSNGSYAEYRGLKPYIDSRAEVFIKKNNHKEDILKECYLLVYNMLDYNSFVNKYKFTHMLISKDESIYLNAKNDPNYKTIYNDSKYSVFERIK